VDLEGLISRNPPIITQACAVDVGAVILDSDHTELQALFNVNIDNPEDIEESHGEISNFHQALLSFGTRIYWSSSQRTLSGQRVSAAQAAEIISTCGITSDDYIFVWHRSGLDVSGLKHFVSQARIPNTLSSDDHIIQLPYIFKHKLSLPSRVQCSLQLLFRGGFFFHNMSCELTITMPSLIVRKPC
jgi:hypothetical protein